MSSKTCKILLFSIVVLSCLLLSGQSKTKHTSVSYWLWAGITANEAPANSELYVFQGRLYVEEGKTAYERLGLYPHPIKSSKLVLVYRLEGQLPDAKTVIEVFKRGVAQWQRHPIVISGIQLDFDSPTAKLLEYSNFLEDIRRQLPQNFELSITGLGDWAIGGNKDALRSISSSTNEIVFQLYQGRQPLPDIETYINALVDYPLPFRIGLLSGSTMPVSVNKLQSNPQYRGVIYFIQK